MTVTDFLLPVFVQVGLTFVLLLLTARERTGALRRGEVRAEDIALRQPNWSKVATQYANAFSNQLELPVLFYLLIVFILITRMQDVLLLILAWVFVLTRIVHAYIHTTSNIVRQRGAVYGIGALVLIVMWVIFAAKIVTGA